MEVCYFDISHLFALQLQPRHGHVAVVSSRMTACTRLTIKLCRRAALAAAAPGARIPYLMDPNTGEALGESADIVRYLFDTYGRGVRETAHAG